MLSRKVKEQKSKKRVNLNRKDAKKNPSVELLYSEYPDRLQNGKFSKENNDTRIRMRLKGFDVAGAKSTKKLWEICNDKLNKEKAIKIAWAISNELNIYLDRDAYRISEVLFKWFEENWSQISQIIDNVKLDENGNVQISKPEFVLDLDPLQNNTFEVGNDWIYESPYQNTDNLDVY